MDDVTSPGARMRKRAFLHETRRLTKKQGGVTTRHDLILEGVYELEPKPDWRTEQRLATQLGLDPVAVTTWFRNRRVKDKRRNQRVVGTWMLSLVFVVLACVYLWELDGLENLMRLRKQSGEANKRHMTKSGLPRPYAVKGPFENQFKKPTREAPAASESKTSSGGKSSPTKTSSSKTSSYFGSPSAGATAGRVRKAEVDQEWDKRK